ncbi:hypothetical protein CJ179_38270 [Rhodococcus sp. ACS1]|nr:hypothetical protein CJ179_38270 [Rhodococcus sp. ACS1]
MTEFLGTVASQAAMLALTGQRGDWCTRTDLGTDFQLIAEPSSTLASWRQMTYPASPISTVAGRTGAITLTSSDLTDSTATGRSVVQATDAAAARTAIGALQSQAGANSVYVKNGSSADALISYSSATTASTIMYRTTGGVTSVGEPTVSTHAATKNYVDTTTVTNVSGAAGLWIGPVGSLPGTGTTGVLYVTY